MERQSDLFNSGGVDPKTALKAIEEAARRLGVEVRYENLQDDDVNIASGACAIKGGKLVIIDTRHDAGHRWKILAAAIKELADASPVYLPPLARELFESM